MNIIDAGMIKGASRERDILLDVTQAENGDTAADVAADAATRAPAERGTPRASATPTGRGMNGWPSKSWS